MSAGMPCDCGAFPDIACFKALIISETEGGSHRHSLTRSWGEAVMASSKIMDSLFGNVKKCSANWASMSFFSVSKAVWSDVWIGVMPTDLGLYTAQSLMEGFHVGGVSYSLEVPQIFCPTMHFSSVRAFVELAVSSVDISPFFGHSSCLGLIQQQQFCSPNQH